MNFICKIPPRDWNSGHGMDVRGTECFDQEIYLYNVVLEQFRKFQMEKRISPCQSFNSYARCQSAGIANGIHYLIMEDLKARSFVMFDKSSRLDRTHVQLIVEELAKFHACSFALRDQQPEIFERVAQPDVPFEMVGRKVRFAFCIYGLNQALRALENCDEEMRRRLEYVKENCGEIMKICSGGVGSENYRVVTHGDCWNNNMLFRYQNGTPVELCFVDWQASRFTSPVTDLSYYFYNSTEQEILEDHFDDLMNVYHDQLSRSIRLLGSDPEKLYPYDVFQNDLKKFAKFGLIVAVFGLNFMLVKSDAVPNFNELVNVVKNDASVEEYMGHKVDNSLNDYNSRIKVIIKHAIDRDYI